MNVTLYYRYKTFIQCWLQMLYLSLPPNLCVGNPNINRISPIIFIRNTHPWAFWMHIINCSSAVIPYSYHKNLIKIHKSTKVTNSENLNILVVGVGEGEAGWVSRLSCEQFSMIDLCKQQIELSNFFSTEIYKRSNLHYSSIVSQVSKILFSGNKKKIHH